MEPKMDTGNPYVKTRKNVWRHTSTVTWMFFCAAEARGRWARLAVEVVALRAALPGGGIATEGASSGGVQPADSPTVDLMSLPGQRRGPARFAPGLAEQAAAIQVLRADGFPVGADERQEGPAFGPSWDQGKTCELLNTATPCDSGAKWIHPRCV